MSNKTSKTKKEFFNINVEAKLHYPKESSHYSHDATFKPHKVINTFGPRHKLIITSSLKTIGNSY
jgi:hypothetical protein